MCLKALFGGGAPKPPPMPPLPPPPEPPPTRDDPQINADAEAERRRRLAARGIGSTILTGPLGDTSDANLGKSLLGN